MPVRGVELATGYITLSVKYAGAMSQIADDVARLEGSGKQAAQAIQSHLGRSIKETTKNSSIMGQQLSKATKAGLADLKRIHREYANVVKVRQDYERQAQAAAKRTAAATKEVAKRNELIASLRKKNDSRSQDSIVKLENSPAANLFADQLKTAKSEHAALTEILRRFAMVENEMSKVYHRRAAQVEKMKRRDSQLVFPDRPDLGGMTTKFFKRGFFHHLERDKTSRTGFGKTFIDPFFKGMEGMITTRGQRVSRLLKYTLFQPIKAGGIGVQKAFLGMAKGGWSAMKALGGAFKGPLAQIAAVTAGIGGLSYVFSKGFQRIRAIQDAKTALKSLGRSVQDVNRMMESLERATRGTAYGTTDMINAAVAAMNEGIEPGTDLEKHLEKIADIAAATGMSIDETVQTLQRAKIRPEVNFDDIQRLTGPRSPVAQWVQESLGITPETFAFYLEEGKLYWDDVMGAIEEHTKGAAREAANTLTGQMTRLESVVGKLGEAILSPFFGDGGGAMPSLIDMVESFAVTMKEAMPGIIKGLGDAFQKVMQILWAGTLLFKMLNTGLAWLMRKVAMVLEVIDKGAKVFGMGYLTQPLEDGAEALRVAADTLSGGEKSLLGDGSINNFLEDMANAFDGAGEKVNEMTESLADATWWTNALGNATAEFTKENEGTWGETDGSAVRIKDVSEESLAKLREKGFDIKTIDGAMNKDGLIAEVEVTAKSQESQDILDAIRDRKDGGLPPLSLPIIPDENESKKEFDKFRDYMTKSMDPIEVPIVPGGSPLDILEQVVTGGGGGLPPLPGGSGGGPKKFRSFAPKGRGPQGVNANIGMLSQVASGMGLQLTSGVRNEPGSYHHGGEAGDFSNGSTPTPEMDAFALALIKNYTPYISELIYSGIPYNIHDGKIVPAIDMPGSPYTTGQAGYHGDHVHVAIKDDAVGGGGGFGGGFRGFAPGRSRSSCALCQPGAKPRGDGNNPAGIARMIYDMARQRGYTDDEARSIVAYAVGESGLNPTISGGIQGGKGDPFGDNVIGLFQQKPDFARRGGIDPSQRGDPAANTYAYLNHLEAHRHLPIEQALPRTSVGGPLAKGGEQDWAMLRRRADGYLAGSGGGMMSFGPRPMNGPGDKPPPPPLNQDIGGQQHGSTINLDTSTVGSTFVNPLDGQTNPFAAPNPWGWGPAPSDFMEQEQREKEINDRIQETIDGLAELDQDIKDAQAELNDLKSKDTLGRSSEEVKQAESELDQAVRARKAADDEIASLQKDLEISKQQWKERLSDSEYSADKYAYGQRGKGDGSSPFGGPLLPDLGELGTIAQGGIAETFLPPGFSNPFENPLVKIASGLLNFVGSLQSDPAVRSLFQVAGGLMGGDTGSAGSALMDLIPAPLGNWEPSGDGGGAGYADAVPGGGGGPGMPSVSSLPGVGSAVPQQQGPFGPATGPLPGPPPPGAPGSVINTGPQYNNSVIGQDPHVHAASLRNNQQAQQRAGALAPMRIYKT